MTSLLTSEMWKTQGNGGKCRRDERRDCLNNAGGKITTAKHTHERYIQVCFCFRHIGNVQSWRKPHWRQLMMHEGLEELSHFIGGDFNPYHCNSALRGKRAIKYEGCGQNLEMGLALRLCAQAQSTHCWWLWHHHRRWVCFLFLNSRIDLA